MDEVPHNAKECNEVPPNYVKDATPQKRQCFLTKDLVYEVLKEQNLNGRRSK